MDGELSTVVSHLLRHKVNADLHALVHSQSGGGGADTEGAGG